MPVLDGAPGEALGKGPRLSCGTPSAAAHHSPQAPRLPWGPEAAPGANGT